jgi:hypothetical protein
MSLLMCVGFPNCRSPGGTPTKKRTRTDIDFIATALRRKFRKFLDDSDDDEDEEDEDEDEEEEDEDGDKVEVEGDANEEVED